MTANVNAQKRMDHLANLPAIVGDDDEAQRKFLADASPEQQRVIADAAKFQLTHRGGPDYAPHGKLELTGAEGGPIDVRTTGIEAWEKLQIIKEAEDD
jgi:hypothetical protein